MGESMSKKLGPLKTWQWGVLAGGVLLAYYLYSKKGEGTETKTEAPAESFLSTPNTEAGTSGSGGGSSTPSSGTSAEQPAPAPAAPSGTGEAYYDGVLQTEIEEVKGTKAALEGLGLLAPAQGANPALAAKLAASEAHAKKEHNRIVAQEKKGAKKPGNSKARKKATHAPQGGHHNTSQVHKPAKKASPHAGANHAARSHAKTPAKHAPVQHAASHHKRKG